MGESARSDAGQQRFTALERANRVRLARARLKRLICGGELSAAEVVIDCPWEAHTMAVSEVLMSQKRWGIQRCRRVLVPIGIPENKEVGTLTERQRTALLDSLGGVEDKPEDDSGGAAMPRRPVPPPQAPPASADMPERALSAAA